MGYDFGLSQLRAPQHGTVIDSHGRSNLVSLPTNRAALSGRAVIVTCDQAHMKHTRINKQPLQVRGCPRDGLKMPLIQGGTKCIALM
jgi:hypothetical protein